MSFSLGGLHFAALLLMIVSLTIGFFIFLRPAQAIEIQKGFYAKINWRLEPINPAKEVKNTRIMGLGLIVVSVAAALLMLRKEP